MQKKSSSGGIEEIEVIELDDVELEVTLPNTPDLQKWTNNSPTKIEHNNKTSIEITTKKLYGGGKASEILVVKKAQTSRNKVKPAV